MNHCCVKSRKLKRGKFFTKHFVATCLQVFLAACVKDRLRAAA